MTPKHQNKRILTLTAFGILLIAGTVALFSALRDNTQFFYNPSEILQDGFTARSDEIRIGGLVVPGSVVKDNELTTHFSVQDFDSEGSDIQSLSGQESVAVTYTGVLPGMFAEGAGIVIKGQLVGDRDFVANEVLAKHDENYQPVKKSYTMEAGDKS